MPGAMRSLPGVLAVGLLLLATAGTGRAGAADEGPAAPDLAPAPAEDSVVALATFAGGCFWCMEPPFDELEGVISTISGYAGGPERNPTYEEVAGGRTGHAEVIQVAYDPAKISYDELLRIFWRNIDPFAVDRQFCDTGRQYRSGIFYHDESQRQAAEASLAQTAARFDQPVVTQLEPVGDTFHPAEEYHQDYYLKNPVRYRYYRYNCGRDRRLEQIWGAEAGG